MILGFGNVKIGQLGAQKAFFCAYFDKQMPVNPKRRIQLFSFFVCA